MTGRARLLATALFATAGLASPRPAPAQAASDPSLVFEKIEAMVPMRDGVRLETHVYLPKIAKEKLPFLFMRTPYGFSPDAKGFSTWLSLPWLSDMLRDGYVLVLQSVRGRFRSEGEYVMERAPRDRTKPGTIDDGTDAYDTVEWLLANVPSSGRVGMLGVSVPGRLVTQAMLEHHPAVKAYSPQASPADNFLGDDVFHGGAFRLAAMFPFFWAMETSKAFNPFQFDRLDQYDWYLALGPLSNANARHFRGKVPSWNDFIAHPTYDAYWKSRSVPLQLTKVPAPTLHVGGQFDQENRRGPVAIYAALEKGDAKGQSFLVQGPWAHRTWRLQDGDHLGKIDFGSATGRFFREEVQAAFFACHLKDRCGAPLPEALVFQTGSNVWQRLDAWPPRSARERSVWLHPGGRLSFEPPAGGGDADADAFVSDPASPVPHAPRPIVADSFDEALAYQGWSTWLLADQRFVDGRPDVLTWRSEPLPDDVVLSGQITANLFVSTTGTDADFVAKLIDVLPEKAEKDAAMGGYELMVAGEILRGRFRRSFEKPEPFAPGKVEEMRIDLLTRNHVFKKGHRIMVQVQSTWFPLYDRNPQTFVPSIFEATEKDFRAQTHRVHRSRKYPSRVVFQSPP